MVKTYLKYQIVDILGQITGKQCKPVIDNQDCYIYCGCNEYIIKISLKTGLVERRISCDTIKSPVTCLCISEDNTTITAGYENGNIVMYDMLDDFSASKQFKLHKSEITFLTISSNLLASGSKDTNILIWDIIGQEVLYRLSGHRDQIIKLHFSTIKLNELEDMEVIISAARDNTIKVWNYKIQECVQTMSHLVHKVSDFIAYNNVVVVGSYDNKLKIYSLAQDENEGIKTYLQPKGTLTRQISAKIISMNITNDQRLFAILSADSSIEFFKILSNAEIKKRMINVETAKLKKKEKLIKKDQKAEILVEVKNLLKSENYNHKMNFYPLFKFMNDVKITGVVFYSQNRDSYNFVLALKNNSLEAYEMITKLLAENMFKDSANEIDQSKDEIKINETNLEIKKNFAVDAIGHRDIIRVVKFGETGKYFLTASNESVKLWNLNITNSVKTIELKNILSACFILSDKYVALASKSGELFLYDVNSLECVASESKAHEGEIWNIHPIKYNYMSEKYKLVTCSSDKTIKYWTLNFTEGKKFFQKQNDLSVSNMSLFKTLDTVDQITYCMVSPDGKFIIYSLLDNSIRIFFEDTNKFYLSLYGHKLPVLSFDVSSDNSMLISGSADKNVKIWGMDFGDCHKSIFAHQDSITCVKFVKGTHYFFSSSKDKTIRYWDADSYELIMEFCDFYAEVWSLDINLAGTTMIGVSADKSIRIYEITTEQIIIEVEKENRLDKIIEQDLQGEFEDKNKSYVNKEIEKLVPVKKSLENMTIAEDLMESLDLTEKFKEDVYQYEISLEEFEKSKKLYEQNKMNKIKLYNLERPEKPKPSLFLLGKNIFQFLLEKIKKISSSDLESTLNNLPYSYVQTLMFYLEYFIRNNIEIELSIRCVIFLTNLFENQVSNDKTLFRILDSIRHNMRKHLGMTKDLLNFNIHSINLILLASSNKKKSIEEFKASTKSKEASFSFI